MQNTHGGTGVWQGSGEGEFETPESKEDKEGIREDCIGVENRGYFLLMRCLFSRIDKAY